MRPIFHYFCNVGIQITTDAWKGYNFLRQDGWRHLMVVHKRYSHLNMEECVCLCSWGILCARWRGLIQTTSSELGGPWKGTCRFVFVTTLNVCLFWGCSRTQEEWRCLASILTCILGYSGTILNGAECEMIKFTTKSTNVWCSSEINISWTIHKVFRFFGELVMQTVNTRSHYRKYTRCKLIPITWCIYSFFLCHTIMWCVYTLWLHRVNPQKYTLIWCVYTLTIHVVKPQKYTQKYDVYTHSKYTL